MLGVRRSSVTTPASILHDAGAIEYRRAVIKVLDRKKLQKTVFYSTIRRAIDMGSALTESHGRRIPLAYRSS
jgi:hypothetical protein